MDPHRWIRIIARDHGVHVRGRPKLRLRLCLRERSGRDQPEREPAKFQNDSFHLNFNSKPLPKEGCIILEHMAPAQIFVKGEHRTSGPRNEIDLIRIMHSSGNITGA
jgi:hypothetical protein